MTTMTTVTPLQVLDAAIERLSEPDGYISHDYHNSYAGPEEATAHCAIGGVEHGIWKLLKYDVSGMRDELAYTGVRGGGDETIVYTGRVQAYKVYAEVMRVLNEEACR